MVTALTDRVGVRVTPAAQVSTVAEIAETVCGDALRLARKGLSGVPRDTELADLLRDPAFVNLFKYRMACAAGRVLGRYDPHVEEVYYFYSELANPDLDLGGDGADDPCLHLLLRVTPPTAALESLIAALDRGLVGYLKQLPWDQFASRESVLDVNLVTAAEVRAGTGWAAALKSVVAPPVRLWPREA